jgi:hypothetical protein
MRSLRDFPLTAARWFLLGNVVSAAWLYGGTREWAREWVSSLLLANTALFVLGITARLRMPRIPLPAALGLGFLLLQGWFMTWNAKRQFITAAQVFVDRQQPWPGWPGFMDTALVQPSILLTTGLLGAFCMACDMTPNRIWRQRLWITLAGTGISIVILGLAQRLSDAPSIFWDLEQNLGWTFFGVFRYHANAGSFINLVLPLIVGLAVDAYFRAGAEKSRVFWTLAALITAAAGFVNVSRAANVLCALLLACMSIWIAVATAARFSLSGPWIRWSLAVGMFALAAVLALSFGMEKTLMRWEIGSWQILRGDAGRTEAYEIMTRSAIPVAGAWGFGPGTFEQMFNIHRAQTGSSLEGRWDKAHSDALQTPMDWGWTGAIAWSLLLIGGLIRGLRSMKQSSRSDRGQGILSAACVFSLAGVMIHALVDFPLQIASLQLFTMLIAGMLWAKGKVLKSKVEG